MDDKQPSNELNQDPIDAELNKEEQRQESEIDIDEILRSLKSNSRRDERIIAFFIVYAADRFDYTVGIDDLVEQFRAGFDVDILSESFALTLARGVIEARYDLDEQIKPYLKNWKLERLGCCTRLILRMSLWELRQQDAIPSIIINEAVELAKTFAEKDAYKFINGILDEIGKAMGLTPVTVSDSDKEEKDNETAK
jgi:N utilization substance protein B